MVDKEQYVSIFGYGTPTKSSIKVPHNSPAISPHYSQSNSPEVPISYEQPVPPVSNLFYECKIEETFGKGFGLFAEQDIPKGKTIIIERPSLVYGPLTEEHDTSLLHDLKDTSSSFVESDFLESFIELSLKDQSDIMLLDNCCGETFEWPRGELSTGWAIAGKFMTNRFRISSELAGIYFRCAFLNHSCEPNCSFRMIIRKGLVIDPGHKWLLIRAEQEIKAGDELTISYIPRNTSFEGRQAFLYWCYGFRCGCSRCLEDKARLYPDGNERYIFKKKQNIELQRIKSKNLHAKPQGRKSLTVVTAITGGGPLFPKNGIVLEETPLMLISSEELRIIRTDSGEPCQDYHPMITRFLQLSFEARKEFLSLHSWNSSKNRATTFINEDSIPSPEALSNIWKVNQIALDSGMEGVFQIISNLSHSCMPTCQVSWNPEHKTLNLVAIKTLKVGDEITICYGGIKISGYSLRTRRCYLKAAYGFDCSCPKCIDEIQWEVSSLQASEVLQHSSNLLKDILSQNIQKNSGKAPYRLSKSCLLGPLQSKKPKKSMELDENRRPDDINRNYQQEITIGRRRVSGKEKGKT